MGLGASVKELPQGSVGVRDLCKVGIPRWGNVGARTSFCLVCSVTVLCLSHPEPSSNPE